MLEFFFR